MIGHRGAAAVAGENSPEALRAAVDAGADLVEFDVARGLVVAHGNGMSGPSLGDVLDLLAPHQIGLHVDLKWHGDEQAVLEAIDARGLRDRVLISTAYARIARRVRDLAPDLRIAIGYPRDSYGVSRFSWPSWVVEPGVRALRAVTPARLPLLIRVARANMLALHHTLCTPRAISAAGVPVFVWTVNDPAEVRRFAAMGVAGIVSDDPKIALATLNRP